jgi:trimethylamine:corrinoid methyltransferase-like protein
VYSLVPQIPYLMSEEQLQSVHLRALRILDQVGLKISDPRLARRLRGRQGLRWAGDRALFDPALVAELTGFDQRCRPPAAEPQRPEHISVVTSYHARSFVDLETGRHRPLTEQDAIAMARLSDALRGRDVLGGAPGAPQDLPPRLRSVAQYKISAEWSREGHYAPVSSVAEYRAIREMARVLGHDFSMECYLISPLRLEGDEVSAVIEYLETCSADDKPVPVTTLSMPTMGLSGPVDPLGIFVLGLAESLGGCAALSLAYGADIAVRPSRPNAYPCDFRTGSLVVGSPEAALIEIVRRDLDRFYGHDTWARALRTMTGVVGIQAAVEKAAGAVAAALAGYTAWFGGGLIGLDEVFSPVQLMIDCEIRDYALQVARGFVADEQFDDVAVLWDVLRDTDASLPFMTHPTTIANYRAVFRNPRLFHRDHQKSDTWGSEDIIERAQAEARQLIQSHTYRLTHDRLREIERIYARAQQELG